MPKILFWIVCNFLSIIILFSCQSQKIETPYYLSIGDLHLRVALANNEQRRAQGLMKVKKIEKKQGMLFQFDRPQKVSFWMKNTSLPLAVAYINTQGVIVEIHNMTPFSEKPVPSRYKVLYALEVLQGVFEEYNIRIGDKVLGLSEINSRPLPKTF